MHGHAPVSIGRLAAIWRYPVSSTAGEALQRCGVGPTGLAGDRTHALVDPAAAESAMPERMRRWHPTPLLRSRLTPAGAVEIAAPLQPWSPAAQAGPALAAHFGFPVEIRAYADGAMPRYVRDPVHVLTTSSLRALQALLPESAIAVTRFRPNLVLDTPPGWTGFVEQDWLGLELQIGAVHLRFARPCARCSFTTLPQDDLARDRDILRTLVQDQGRMFGMHCEVLRGGDVETGDAVMLRAASA